MSFSLLRAADRAAVPWKNGGGVTREVAAWPAGSGFDDFAWRVSMAEVHEAGPFSTFPGVDRVLAVLVGRLQLILDGRPPVTLSPDSRPQAFPGDVATLGALGDGPVLDLNVMSRRNRIRASLRRLDVFLPQVVAGDGETWMVIAGANDLRVVNAEAACDLGPYDAVLFQKPESGLLIESATPTVAYLATFAIL